MELVVSLVLGKIIGFAMNGKAAADPVGVSPAYRAEKRRVILGIPLRRIISEQYIAEISVFIRNQDAH